MCPPRYHSVVQNACFNDRHVSCVSAVLSNTVLSLLFRCPVCILPCLQSVYNALHTKSADLFELKLGLLRNHAKAFQNGQVSNTHTYTYNCTETHVIGQKTTQLLPQCGIWTLKHVASRHIQLKARTITTLWWSWTVVFGLAAFQHSFNSTTVPGTKSPSLIIQFSWFSFFCSCLVGFRKKTKKKNRFRKKC